MEPIYIAVICISAAIFAALAALFVYFSNSVLKVTRYRVGSAKIQNKIKIVHLTDLHAKRFGKDNCRLLKKVEREAPDFIAFTGDIIHKYRDKDIAVALSFAAALSKIAPVFYVSGNHEMRNKRYRQLKEGLIAAGFKVLDDESVEAFGITVAGVNCAHVKCGGYYSIERGEGFNLLLTHLPQYIDKYALAGYDAVLCGHAHGGQWRIPFTKIGVFSPGQGLFPKYASGVHWCGDMCEIISRGLGNSQCPIRLFNRPEIVVAELCKREEKNDKG